MSGRWDSLPRRVKRSITTCVLWLSALAVQADDTSTNAKVEHPELRSELLQRAEIDQSARIGMTKWLSKNASKDVVDTRSQCVDQKAEFDKLSAAIKKVDSENNDWLKEVVENHGWPTTTLVGKDGARAAWLLIQHADADPQFQRKCLDLMVKLPSGKVSQKHIAFLTDRVLLAEGKKQVYGTQFSKVDGKLRPRALEDEANVDKRRAEVGLPPLAEYAKQIEKIYGGSSKRTGSSTAPR